MQPFTLPDLLQRNLLAERDKVAVIHHDKSATYAGLARRALEEAHWLRELGLRKGDRVVLHAPKSIAEIVYTFAVSLAGGLVVNVNSSATRRMLQHVLTHSGARMLLTSERAARALTVGEKPPPSLEHVLDIQARPEVGPADAITWDAFRAERSGLPSLVDKDDCSLIYTSGSTGLPKGVLLNHHMIVQSARIAATYLEARSDDRMMGALAFSFDAGFSQLTSSMLVGATLVLPRAVLVNELLQQTTTHGVNAIQMVPTLWIPFVRTLKERGMALEDVRYVAVTGGKLPTDVMKAWPEVFPNARCYLMYGLTEGFRSSYLDPADYQRKMGSIGKPLPNVELYVVHPEKGLCGPGEHGERVHRGNLISSGYYRDPDATAEKIRPCPHLAHLIGDEAVLFSGDTVYKDDEGYLWFVARTSTLIKSSEHRISPTEVEDIVFSSGKVTDVVAYGAPDEEFGQVVHVAVTAAPGTGPLDAEALLAHCRREMPPYMTPRKIEIWEGEMPRTPNGKLDRPAVIARLTEAEARRS